MKTYEFSVNLTEPQIRSIYEGGTRYILVYDDSGLKIQLPASNFRPFVTSNGVKGRFSVKVDGNNKLRDLRKR